MRAAIYNPYLDTLGGGERYTAAFASVLVKEGYKVDLEWKSSNMKKRLEERFAINLSGVNITSDIKRGDGYDVCFWVSDGSIPLLRARRNFLHFQFPFKDVGGRSLLNKMKLFRINEVICNSYFTKELVDEEYGIDSLVIYPPVDVEKIRPRKKENVILSVGRFSQLTQAKRQDVLISAFKKLVKDLKVPWRLILAGGVEVGVDEYLERLKKMVVDYRIEIIESPSFEKLLNLYGKAKIFWSASGYGIDEEKEPLKVEHFGITLIEAMAGGAVPIGFAAGGHREIIAEAQNGFLWKKIRELTLKTKNLIEDKNLLGKISRRAIVDSKVYEYERFAEEVKSLIQS